jgi:hypothetical protein
VSGLWRIGRKDFSFYVLSAGSAPVKRLLKILIVIIVVLVAVAFGGVWYLNRWLKSPQTHAEVERELSKSLNLPLKFKSLELSLMGGLRAEGVTVPDEGYNFFEASSFSAKHRLLPLFRGNIVLDEILVEGPKFTLIQRPDGQWKLPELPDDLKPPKKSPGEKSKGPKPAEPQPKPKKEGPDVLIKRIVIANGCAELFDKDRKPFLGASGMTVTLKDVRDEKLEGRVFVARLVRHGVLALTDFNAGVSHSEDKGLIIKDSVAKCGGGTISGGYSRKDEKPASRYTAQMKITDVDLTRAALDGDGPPPNLAGLLSAEFLVRGTGDETKTMTGKGTVTFRNGTCKEIEAVKQYGELVEEAANFGIPLATAEVQVWNGRLGVKPLKISAPPLAITATGIVRFDGKLDLDALLGMDAKFLETRPFLAGQFSQPDASGIRTLPFHVNGTLTKPRNDLREQLAGSKDPRAQKAMKRAVVIESAVESLFGPAEKEGTKPAQEPDKQR